MQVKVELQSKNAPLRSYRVGISKNTKDVSSTGYYYNPKIRKHVVFMSNKEGDITVHAEVEKEQEAYDKVQSLLKEVS